MKKYVVIWWLLTLCNGFLCAAVCNKKEVEGQGETSYNHLPENFLLLGEDAKH